jgi:hypothetical protein
MAIVVEDGTGKPTAESYISLLDAEAYHVAHGNTDWVALSDTECEAALRAATAYIDGTYRGRWKGTRKTSAQALAWPRTGVSDEDGYAVADDAVPGEVRDATCEAALLDATGTDLTAPPRAADITSYRAKVGPIEEETHYGTGTSVSSSSSTGTGYPSVDYLLSGLIVGPGAVGVGVGSTGVVWPDRV